MSILNSNAYDKKIPAFEEQLIQLKARNLVIEDYERARHYLSQISYYRLSAYILPYKNVKDWFDEGKAIYHLAFNHQFSNIGSR